ncbi:MAG: pantoate--beta-alanine ligase [Streptosporangiaceae bacterium]
MMEVARTREELAKALVMLRCGSDGANASVALVPTMGALHAGHVSLIRLARELADHVIVSVFVNPLQFGPGEDYERYPRAFDADLRTCRDEKVSLVFAPSAEVVYPEPQLVGVDPGPMGEAYEGASRSGHFSGVLTVVMKLFQLTRPDLAVFGQKDAQQLALVRRMVRDLDLPVHVVAGATVRDPDGLAVSSRNVYLSAEERTAALALSRALRAGERVSGGGASAVREAALSVLRAEPRLLLDYLALVEPETFADVSDGYEGEAVLAVAATVGTTHLIDNVPVRVDRRPDPDPPSVA